MPKTKWCGECKRPLFKTPFDELEWYGSDEVRTYWKPGPTWDETVDFKSMKKANAWTWSQTCRSWWDEAIKAFRR